MHLVTLVVRALLWLKTLGSMIGSTLAFYCFCNKLCKFISWKQNKTITSQFLSANWVLYLGWNRHMSRGWCLLLRSPLLNPLVVGRIQFLLVWPHPCSLGDFLQGQCHLLEAYHMQFTWLFTSLRTVEVLCCFYFSWLILQAHLVIPGPISVILFLINSQSNYS